jgi:hypothetical protein
MPNKPTAEDMARDLPSMLAQAEFAAFQLAALGLGEPPAMVADLFPALKRAIYAEAMNAEMVAALRTIAQGDYDNAHDCKAAAKIAAAVLAKTEGKP